MLTVTINGTDRTKLIDDYSLLISRVLTNHVDSCQFTINKFGDRSYTPSVDEEVVITQDDTKIFAGYIVHVDQDYDKVDFVSFKIKCVDYTRSLDNRLIVDSFKDQTVSEIVQFIKDKYLPGAIGLNCTVTTPIKYIAFNYEAPSSALRQLAAASNSDWYIDYDKVIQFFPRDSVNAPFDLADTTGKYIYDSLRIRRDLTQLRNVVFVRGGEFLGDTTTAAFIADGTRKNFFLSYRFSNLTVTVTGQEKSVGIDPIDQETNFDALYNFQEKFVRFREDRKPSIDSEVRFGGQPYLPVLVKLRDPASVSTYTAREYVIVDKSIKTKEGARQRALAELLTYKATISEGNFDTYQSGLVPGQKINVVSTNRGIDEDFVINRVVTRVFGTDASDKSVKLVSTVSLITTRTFDYIQLLQQLLNQSKKEIVIADDEILDEVESINEQINFTEVYTASTEHNPLTEEVQVEDDMDDHGLDFPIQFVLGAWTPLDIANFTTGLTHYWKLNEGTGDAIAAAVGGINGTKSGGTWVKSMQGTGLNFAASTDKIDLDSDITVAGDFTFVFWGKLVNNTTRGGIIGDQTSYNNGRLSLYLNNQIWFGGGSPIYPQITGTWPTSEYALIAIRRISDDVKIIINGVDRTDGTFTSSFSFNFNRLFDNPNDSSYVAWLGELDSAMLYNGVGVSDANLLSLYNYVKRQFVLDGSRLG